MELKDLTFIESAVTIQCERFDDEKRAEMFRGQQGPWTDEFDRIEWVDRETMLPCMIMRGPLGHLCGYVGVRAGNHPLYGLDYNKTYDVVDTLDVHGGLTYSQPCPPGTEEEQEAREPEGIWWLGFDCAHAGDMSPTMLEYGTHFEQYNTYRSVYYVHGEVVSLAKQLEAARGDIT